MKKVSIIFEPLKKGHAAAIVFLLMLSLIFFYPLLSSQRILDNVHYVNDMTFESEHYRQGFFEGKGYPLWTPYFYSGQPFMAVPEFYSFDLNMLFILLTRNIFLSMNLAVIAYFFIAGFGIYLLANRFIGNKLASVVAAVMYQFNGFMHTFILHGHLNILESYALIPFIFLFLHDALHKDKMIPSAMLCGLSLGLMVHAGGMIFFLYTGLLIGLYLAFTLFLKINSKKNIMRCVQVSIVLALVFFGVAAFKLLPALEFTSLSSRSGSVTFQEFLGEPIPFTGLFTLVAGHDVGFSASLGIIGFLLVLAGFFSLRKKIVIFSVCLLGIALLLATGSFLAELFYKLPGFGQMRHIERAVVLFSFGASIIAAFGAENSIRLIRKKIGRLPEIALYSVLMILIIVEVVVFFGTAQATNVVSPDTIPIIKTISGVDQENRVATFSLSTPIGASGYNFLAQKGISEVKGGGGIWITDYVQYVAIAQQNLAASLFGVLNAKHVISEKQIDSPGFILKQKFEGCDECKIHEAYGPFLYENQYSMPKAFYPSKTILIVGSQEEIVQILYALMVKNNKIHYSLIPGSTAISSYSSDELKKFDGILLLRDSVTQQDLGKLQRYRDNGGMIFPDVTNGQSSLDQRDLDAFLNKTKVDEIPVTYTSFNSFSIEPKQKGWIVMGEKIAHFPGWQAFQNKNKLGIEKANLVISAVYVEEPNMPILFTYAPLSVKRGFLITLVTLIILILYFSVTALKSINNKKREQGMQSI